APREDAMERLEAKRVKGRTYYSQWARVDNRCRRVWQKYLGKPDDIVAAVQGWASPDRGRGLPVGTDSGSLAGSCPRPTGRANRPSLSQTPPRIDQRSVPGHRRDQPRHQPTKDAIDVGLVRPNRAAATDPIRVPSG